MFVSNNTIVTTEQGLLLADSEFEKIYSFDGFQDVNKESCVKPSVFIKTEIFPTLTIAGDSKLLLGKIYSNGEKIFISNEFKGMNEIQESNYLVVPKIRYKVSDTMNRTMVWLYAKYLVGGYYCLEKQTNKPTIIIKLNKFSKKEATKLHKYDGVTYDLSSKMIFIQNENIISELGESKKNLNPKLYGLNVSMVNYFIHSMLIETDSKLEFQYKTMAYDVFMFAYSMGDKLFKIEEQKNNKKIFILIPIEKTDYLSIKDSLYVRINKVLKGKDVKGFNIENPDNKAFISGFFVIK